MLLGGTPGAQAHARQGPHHCCTVAADHKQAASSTVVITAGPYALSGTSSAASTLVISCWIEQLLVQEQAEEEGGRLYRPVVTPDGVNVDRVDEWPLVEPPFQEAYHEASLSAMHSCRSLLLCAAAA